MTTAVKKAARTVAAVAAAALISFRAYQEPVFRDREAGVQILHWSRQIGKSFTLASWAVDRCLTRPGRLVTVLSNSKDNGAEFAVKCAEVLRQLDKAFELADQDAAVGGVEAIRESPVKYEDMRFEVRIHVRGKTSRIKILAANPRTARGFSGDLILDEFAFHEDSNAIWEAAEPILSSNPDYLCRIASTGNGRHNMFYRMASGGRPVDGSKTLFVSDAGFLVSRVPRSVAHEMGVKIYDMATRRPITPAEARQRALDKRAYDQNYECQFNDENMALLTHELISTAEGDGIGVICAQDWTQEAIVKMAACTGELLVGVDVGRHRDLTVITALERCGPLYLVRAILRIEGMRLPQQQERLGTVCRMPKFRRAAIDMTGIGLGLYEYSQDAFGAGRIQGVDFAATVPVTEKIKREGRAAATARVTEVMATELLQLYEDRVIKHPADPQLRDDLRKPEKVTSPGGRVSIAATRDEAGHADHFWSLALAVEAGAEAQEFNYSRVETVGRDDYRGRMAVL